MHPDDQMTPLERRAALAKGQAVDRYPINMFFGAPAHTLLGWTRRQEQASGANIAAVKRKVYETFGCDGTGADYGLHGMAVAFDAKVSDPEHLPYSILEHPVKNIRDLSSLDLDRLTIQRDPTGKKCYEACCILQDQLGREVGCSMNFPGPFTCASALAGTTQLLKSLITQPEAVHRLLEFTTAGLLQLAKPFIAQGVGISVADPVASGTILSKQRFQTFALPYSKQFVTGCQEMGSGGVGVHICGDTSSILEEVAACGYASFSIDNVVDLKTAKERIGSQIPLSGNVDPVGVMYRGTPAEVRAAVRQCCRDAWDSPKGYVIATGCDTVYGTPLENAYAFMSEARKCARYPYSPQNFQA